MKRVAAFALPLLLATACPSTPPPTGQLVLNIGGLPAGGSAIVHVTGPGGYSQVFSSSQTVSGLALGSYLIEPTEVVTTAPIVSSLYDGVVTGSPATVTASAAATSTVTYTLRPGTGMLWFIASDTTQLLGFSTDQLRDGGALAPAVLLDAGILSDGGRVLDSSEGCAFDSKGNLWVTGHYSNNVVSFSPAQISQSGAPMPVASFHSLSSDGGELLTATEGLAFDSLGNLWVTGSRLNVVAKYSAAQLASVGADATLNPVAIVDSYLLDGGLPDGGSAWSLGYPYDIAFDSSGALWVSSGGVIAKFSHPQNLVGETAPAPDALIVSTIMPGGVRSLNGAQGLSFDSTGDLWVANWNSESLERYANPSALSGALGVVPTAQISDDGGSEMGTLAFDNGGNIWVAHGENTPGNFIYRLPSLAGATGVETVLPMTELTGLPYGDLSKVCFNPAPPSVPIFR